MNVKFINIACIIPTTKITTATDVSFGINVCDGIHESNDLFSSTT